MAWAKYVRVFLLLACAAIVTGVSRNPRDAKGRSPRANGEVELHVASDPWNSTGIKGVQYNPSYSMNSIMTWIDYDASLVATEIGYAASASANTIRVHLNWIPWFLNPTQFLANVENVIGAAAARGVRVILAVFDATGCCDPSPSWVKDGQYNTTGWVQNPGQAMVNNASSWAVLDSYVAALTAAYGRDPRVVGWDVLYQPQLATQQPSGGTFNFLVHFTAAVRGAVDAKIAFTTYSVIPGGSTCDSTQVPLESVNLLSFENYNGNLGAIGGDTCGMQSCAQSVGQQPGHGGAPLPVVLSGTMSREAVPPQGLCDCLFEAYGQSWVDIPSHPPVGVIITSLMIGADGTTTGTPPDRGLVFPNGSWYSAGEEACFTAVVPPIPPPPPGPPPSVVNFTAGGLTVGLRPVSRAIQLLGIENDDLWWRNFSFVPPLWNFLPPQPHRDYPGCHHIGDLVLRVQPAVETDPASWAMYSSAQGAGDVPATPLANPDPSTTYDVSDLTPPLTAGGQADTRFSLGLNVTRFYEEAPGGAAAGGFRLRFAVTNTNASAVRIGSLGIPVLSNSNFGGLNLSQVAAFGSFLDGWPGGAHSFVTMARADGSDMAVAYSCAPQPGLPPTPMEAYRPLLEDAGDTAGGVYAWEAVSGAFAPEWATNTQFPAYMTFPNDPYHQAAWPNPRSPTPSWHLNETFLSLPGAPPRQWNPPTTIVLAPGETRHFAVCFTLATPAPAAAAALAAAGGALKSVAERRATVAAALMGTPQAGAGTPTGRGPRVRDATLARVGAPVLFPIPGYVLGTDMVNASLAVLPPAGASVANASSDDPATLAVTGVAPARPGGPGADVNFTSISLQGLARGPARIVIFYTDGTWQAVNYYVLAPLRDLIAAYGQHAANTAWLPRDFPDPFGRSASVMPWDREDGVHVLQDARPFVVGLSDDAGGSAQLGLASRVALAPTVLQASRLDDYVYWTLLGVKNDTALPPLFSLQDADNRILMTLFYFYNPLLNGTNQTYYQETDKCEISPSWCSFNSPYPGYNPNGWINTYRQYNWPHQLSVYYALYRVARDWAGVAAAAGLRQPWDWYLAQSAATLTQMACPDPETGAMQCVPDVGLMDGTVFREILDALNEEAAAGSPAPGPYSWAQWAANVTAIMHVRVYGPNGDGVGGWVDADAPFGSEFSWDTTGQEEVAVWGAYFNATGNDGVHGELNGRTVDAILAFMPSQPIWAMHGSAYGMGDFSNNAKWMVTGGWEREGGHYRAGLNSIPLVERFRLHPDDLYLLHVGLGGVAAVLPNFDASGAPSMAYHTYPFVQAHDPNSGDFGLGFFGHTMTVGAHLVNHSLLGWACFLCDAVPAPGGALTMSPRDSFRTRVYIEPLGLHLRAWTSAVANVTLDWAARTATVTLEAAGAAAEAWAAELAHRGGPRPAERVLARPPAPGESPFPFYRLQVEAAAPAARPFTFKLVSPAGAALVRGAWQWPAGAPTEPSVAVISW